ncbi:ComEA family DNA-binding protein [Actinomadura flavalba]|uniref:ComEA family DNA-binding protein n=1 Tax=Actinomadura flavalba TaxID=1120938 RepID=UPI000527BC55|nr:helix-hairpin-helix domain-containing protein [Actinomadura flavalba]
MNVPAPYESRVPSDDMPPGRAALSVTWAALPFLTLGYATPFTFAAALLWRRSAHLLVATLGYGAVFTLLMMNLPQAGSEDGRTVAGLLMFVLAVVGCGHAFLIRRRVFDPDGLSGLGNDAEVERVRRHRLLRERARTLAASDPGLARELRIGRPDLPRRYQDGGLIDVNHAPVDVLVHLPGVTRELADRIVAVRAETGGFQSAEEMSLVAELPPEITPDVADFAVFIR